MIFFFSPLFSLLLTITAVTKHVLNIQTCTTVSAPSSTSYFTICEATLPMGGGCLNPHELAPFMAQPRYQSANRVRTSHTSPPRGRPITPPLCHARRSPPYSARPCSVVRFRRSSVTYDIFFALRRPCFSSSPQWCCSRFSLSDRFVCSSTRYFGRCRLIQGVPFCTPSPLLALSADL
ncbi:unnamed protein product [Aphis gossypii]|uniref:Secreted protein n=1 Tax=Aphis gossypii TaxID=80765 RepID=A0A9P0IXD9_APHGO|nr:unnamed protein product [Aphis gossypii]